ncbi:MAG: hypothetical protein OWU33_07010 [Firmicutes bacterium]|nr:hypothetical protein [Bacillota bacterium]
MEQAATGWLLTVMPRARRHARPVAIRVSTAMGRERHAGCVTRRWGCGP